MVRQVVQEALLQTATLLKAEETYSSRRSDFTAIAESQIKEGIYETLTKEERVEDVEGNNFIEKKISITVDENGNPKVRKPSPFKTYNIQIIQFSIKDIDFDETIDALISKKKEAEQQRVVAKAAAERKSKTRCNNSRRTRKS